jgi:XRE family aerobic/anaerobic benzoate catabolism transcriptional regulator
VRLFTLNALYCIDDQLMTLPATARNHASPRDAKRTALLRALGAAVRAQRAESGLTLRVLAKRARVSERFLVQLETGEGNISIARLSDIAEALGTTPVRLLSSAATQSPRRSATRRVLALLGVRGAGKSSIGGLLAKRLKLPMVELDALVAQEASMSLPILFEIHGEAYFRRLERRVLRKFLDGNPAAVLATGGSIVTDPETYALLRRRTVTVWLHAEPRDHWRRVVAQGDLRPMKDRENAMSELEGLLRKRKPLYAQAEHVVDTSSVSLDEAVERVYRAVSRAAE